MTKTIRLADHERQSSIAVMVRQVHNPQKLERRREARILEAFSKFAETSRRGTGSVIGAPEQTSHSSSHCQPNLDTSRPKRPRYAGFEFVCVFGHDGNLRLRTHRSGRKSRKTPPCGP